MFIKAVNGRKRKKNRIKGMTIPLRRDEFEALELNSRLELIMSLIPLALMVVGEELEQEIEQLAGRRYNRKEDPSTPRRHGHNPGTVKLLNQRVPIRVPRVRDANGECGLASYEKLHQGLPLDEVIFKRILRGISCRDYESVADAIPEAIGLSKSTVSKQFKKVSAEALANLDERHLSVYDIVAIFLDGKTFAEDTMVTALGVTMTGEKVVLGFVQTGTENSVALNDFLKRLLNRGLDISRGILAIIDGGKGLVSAVKTTFKKQVVIQRCQWHKRENVVSYLPKSEQETMRKRLQTAYKQATYEEAKAKLLAIRADLEERNLSAVQSLDEGFEETLALHRLGVFALLGISFKTTNGIESLHAFIEQRCAKVDYWKNASQKQRWLAAALQEIEPRLRRVKGYRHLHKLREALMRELGIAAVQVQAA